MDGRIFDIADIIRKPVSAPVPVWGSDDMTCAELYNSLWERFCWDDEFHRASNKKLREALLPLARYLSAIFYERLSRSADVDKEDELQELIDQAFEECDLSNAPFASYRPWFADHNDDDFVFDSDSSLSEWLGEIIDNIATEFTGLASNLSIGQEEELLWMAGERPGHSKPCFKASGWDLVVESMLGEMSLMWASISQGIEMVLIDASDINGFDGREIPYPCSDIEEPDALWKLVTDGTVTKENTRVLIVDHAEWVSLSGYELARFLDVMELVPDGIERFLVIGCAQRSSTNIRKVSELLAEAGLVVLCAPHDEGNAFSSELHGKVKAQYLARNTYQIEGEMPEKIACKLDNILAYFETYNILESMVRMPVEPSGHGVSATQASGGGTERKETAGERHPDFEKLSHISSKQSLKAALHKEFGADRLAKAMTFGLVDISDIDEGIVEGGMFNWRSVLVLNIHADSADGIGATRFPTPKRDILSLAKDLFDREGIFSPSNGYPSTIYDDGKVECDEYMDVFERRVGECVAAGIEAGIDSSLMTFRDGVPAEDILA